MNFVSIQARSAQLSSQLGIGSALVASRLAEMSGLVDVTERLSKEQIGLLLRDLEFPDGAAADAMASKVKVMWMSFCRCRRSRSRILIGLCVGEYWWSTCGWMRGLVGWVFGCFVWFG